jgi:hypothetical protein
MTLTFPFSQERIYEVLNGKDVRSERLREIVRLFMSVRIGTVLLSSVFDGVRVCLNGREMQRYQFLRDNNELTEVCFDRDVPEAIYLLKYYKDMMDTVVEKLADIVGYIKNNKGVKFFDVYVDVMISKDIGVVTLTAMYPDEGDVK